MHKILFLGLLAVLGSSFAAPPDKTLMSSVSSLTFYKDRWTTGRRSSPVPQLSCVSGSCSESPSVIQCVATGWDGRNPQWKCEADLPSHLKLGPVEVSCEGYDYPDDPYILHGSCGLEFSLQQVSGGTHYSQHTTYQNYVPPQHHNSGHSWFGELVAFFVFVGIFYLVFKTCLSGPSAHSNPSNPSNSYPTGAYPSAYPAAAPYVHAPASGPGFWSGFGLGSLLSWRPRWGYGGGYNYGAGYGGYGGGYGSYSRPSYTSSYRPSYSSGSSSRSSTSFGGTRRR